jgi:acetyl esterase/lipase
MSPYADLTLAGATMDTKSDVDPAFSLISLVFADLSGLPPLIIQAGTHEVLLDDAVRLAQRAGHDDVAVTLDLTPKVPHVFQNFYPVLDEAADALDRAGRFLTAHLASAARAAT